MCRRACKSLECQKSTKCCYGVQTAYWVHMTPSVLMDILKCNGASSFLAPFDRQTNTSLTIGWIIRRIFITNTERKSPWSARQKQLGGHVCGSTKETPVGSEWQNDGNSRNVYCRYAPNQISRSNRIHFSARLTAFAPLGLHMWCDGSELHRMKDKCLSNQK